MEIKIYTKFDDIEAEWRRAYNKGFNFHLNVEWSKSWWNCFKNKKRELYILTIFESDNLKLLMPLYKEGLFVYPIGSNPTLYDEFDLIYFGHRYIKVMLDFLKEHKLTLEAYYLNASTNVAKLFTKYMKQNRVFYDRKIVENKPEIIFSSFSFDRKKRDEKKRLENKVKKIGDISFEKSFDIDSFIEMHKKRWSGGPFDYIKNYDKFVEELIIKDIAVQFKLSVDNKILAYHFGMVDSKGNFNSIIPTYNIEYQELSLGKYMLFKTIDWCLDNSINMFDFGRGSEPYKYWFANSDAILFHIRVHSSKNIYSIIYSKISRL